MAKQSNTRNHTDECRAVITECSNGHKMIITVTSNDKETTCSECQARSAFFYVYPDRAAMWDAKKNKRTDPKKIFPEDTDLRFFICKQGHRFRRNPWGRAKRGFCPLCLDLETEC